MADIRQGHVLDALAELPDDSVHMVCTSPPFWGLRDYGIPPQVWGGEAAGCEHEWHRELVAPQSGGSGVASSKQISNRGTQGSVQQPIERAFCRRCGAWRGSLGLEPDWRLYVEHIVAVFREVRRVLRPDGTLFLNLGDCYATGAGKAASAGGGDQGAAWNGKGPAGYRGGHGPQPKHPNGEFAGFQPNRMPQAGLKPKDLVGIPWRVAFALQDDGWWLRRDIIWAKKNPMPESVEDRCTSAHEYLFHFAKSEKYFYDAEAVKEASETSDPRRPYTSQGAKELDGREVWHSGERRDGEDFSKRNRRSVWWLASEPFAQAHFATFPQKLVEPCILAGTSARGVCPACGAPWVRIMKKELMPQPDVSRDRGIRGAAGQKPMDASNRWEGVPRGSSAVETTGWQPTCACAAGEPAPAVILDPFIGSGTTAMVAERLGRRAIGIDLNPGYLAMAERRTREPGLALA